MPLSKENIAEIQAAARVNFHRAERERIAREEDKKAVAEAVAKAKATPTTSASKKGK